LQHNPATYDYIILGAGCAGLSLLMRILKTPELAEKRILLIDKRVEITNDRTWSFWEKEPGFFENIVHKKWKQLLFESDHFSAKLEVGAYQYKMIRGIDFYNECFAEIAHHKNVEIIYDDIISFSSAQIKLTNTVIDCGHAIVFNSTYKQLPQQKNKYYLLQHFKGRVIETEQPFFDAETATLMDFRVHQQHGTAFVYIMPFSATAALIEYTLFSPVLLPEKQYDAELNDYILNVLHLKQHTTVREEFGIIPMTNAVFPIMEHGVFNIGTAGGQTKASSGYTFQFIQKQSAHIISQLLQNKQTIVSASFYNRRFKLYDSTLLNILFNGKLGGADFFAQLYQRNTAAAIFKFLDNETSLAEEIKIMNTVPKWLFTKTAISEMFK
jgi:lycopene beta-cyclase